MANKKYYRFTIEIKKALKNHKCIECTGFVSKDEKYIIKTVYNHGFPSAQKYHKDCFNKHIIKSITID